MGILGKYSRNIQGVFKELSGNDGLKLISSTIVFAFNAKSTSKLMLEINVNILFLLLKSKSFYLKTKHFSFSNSFLKKLKHYQND
jgi:hypothetical protein